MGPELIHPRTDDKGAFGIYRAGAGLNTAMALLLASIVSVHIVLVPEQAPSHSAKTEPAFAVALRVTTVLAS